MSVDAVLLLLVELVGSAIVGLLGAVMLSFWWRRQDRREAERQLRREVLNEARRAAR